MMLEMQVDLFRDFVPATFPRHQSKCVSHVILADVSLTVEFVLTFLRVVRGDSFLYDSVSDDAGDAGGL